MANNRNQATEFSLFDLPNEMVMYITSYIKKTRDKAAFARLCVKSPAFFQAELNNLARPLVTEALSYAVNGQKEELMNLLRMHPGVLYKKDYIKDPAGRIIYGTVYQSALGAKDWQADIGQQEMVEMIEEVMEEYLSDGYEEIKKQRREQFPKGWKKIQAEREKLDSNAINIVFDAIAVTEKYNTPCKKYVKEFIDYLKAQDALILRSGYHFNDKLLLQAYELYINAYIEFKGFQNYDSRLAAFKVIQNIQLRMPACMAMAHREGINKLTLGHKILNRMITFESHSAWPYFIEKQRSPYFIYNYSNFNYQKNISAAHDSRSNYSLATLQELQLFLRDIKHYIANKDELGVMKHMKLTKIGCLTS